jgi:hypothetical protein
MSQKDDSLSSEGG